MRAFGPELAEVPLLTTRAELQGNGLGPLLLHSLEAALLLAGVSKVIMPALPLQEAPLPAAVPATGASPRRMHVVDSHWQQFSRPCSGSHSGRCDQDM